MSVAEPAPCPTDDVLAALIDRQLAPADAERIAAHIDDCAGCRAVAIAAVRARPALATGTPSLPLAITPPRSAALPAGAKLGRYEIRRLIGAGGMGQVYEAYDAELDRAIAVKLVDAWGARAVQPGLAERLMRESRMIAKIAHPSVITVHDVGRDGAAVFIAMELVRGSTLGAYIAAAPRARDEVLALYERAGGGLAAAHRASVVHRDFKPDNVLVELDAGGRATRVLVTDFGIARIAGDGERDRGADGDVRADDARTIPGGGPPRLTAAGMAIGTPAYMAPEQLDGRDVDARADIFAFAVSLWESLFGARPFPGATTGAIRAAMATPPRAPAGAPHRLVRALQRGLALDRADRWPTMDALVRELAAIRAAPRRRAIAAATTALAAAGALGAVSLAHESAPPDPCAAALAPLVAAYDPITTAAAIRAALDPAAAAKVTARFDRAAASLRATHAQTCRADRTPAQDPAVAACLEARRIELAGTAADLSEPPPHANASAMAALVGDPARCAAPSPGALVARVPADPALRHRVTALREQMFAAEALRDHQDFTGALAVADRMLAAAPPAWPMLRAEALYARGTTLSFAGKVAEAQAALHDTVVAAETAHADYIAANAWIQLALSAADDDGNPTRALEYLGYANAAVDRLGRTPDVVALYDYVRGSVLVDLHRNREAEAAFTEALAAAPEDSPALVPEGLAYLYDDEGRYTEAVALYRRALAGLPPDDHGSPSAINFRERLAQDLALVGQAAEAEQLAREAVAIADRTLGPNTIDTASARLALAEVLAASSKGDEALATVRAAVAAMKIAVGDRGERYGMALRQEADVLADIGRAADAVPVAHEACEILSFAAGDDPAALADCYRGEAGALAALGPERLAEAIALADKSVAVFAQQSDPTPQLANAISTRAQIEQRAGRVDAAVADLERAIAMLERFDHDLEPGFLAQARFSLGRALWTSDPARAKPLVTAALGEFRQASAHWKSERAYAESWAATGGHPTVPEP